MTDCAEGTLCCYHHQMLPEYKCTKQRINSETTDYYGSSSSYPEKAKSKGEKTYEEKRQASVRITRRCWCQWVASGCSKHMFLGNQWVCFALQTCFLLLPMQWFCHCIMYEDVTHNTSALINVIMWYKGGTVWFLIMKTSPYVLLLMHTSTLLMFPGINN